MVAATPLSSQIFPLENNDFGDPQFKKRFLGSYGAVSELEPVVSRDEATLLQELYQLLSNNQLPEAIAKIESILTEESSAAMDYTLGNLKFQAGQSAAAINAYKAAILKFPSFLRAYANLGRIYVQEGRYEEALPMLTKALELGSVESDLFGLIGFINLNLGNYDSAISAYEMARMLNPSSKDWQVGLVQALLMSEQFGKAVPSLRELLELYPDETRFYLNLANAYLGLQDYTNTSGILEIVRRMGTASSGSLSLLADIYMNQQLYQLALPVYLEAFDRGENFPIDRQIRVAQLFLQRGALQETSSVLRKIEIQKSSLDETELLKLLNVEAELKQLKGDFKESNRILVKILEMDPLNGKALLQVANQNWATGDIETAAYYFKRAESIPEVRYNALLDHARMLVSANQFREALPMLREVLALNPSKNLKDYVNSVESVAEASLR